MKVIKGDCLEVLKTIENESIDIVFTSPPYNLGNGHHTGGKRHKAYNDNMPEIEYQQWQMNILNECFRVLKASGSLIYNHKNRIKNGVQITPYEWLLKTPFTIKQELVWFNGSQNFDKIRFYPMTERVYWLTKSPRTKLINSINHHDFWAKDEWRAVGTKGQHTRAFPEKMVEDILTCFPESEVVLDPFAGSGTVGVVCKKMGKDYILIEKEDNYIKLINERL